VRQARATLPIPAGFPSAIQRTFLHGYETGPAGAQADPKNILRRLCGRRILGWRRARGLLEPLAQGLLFDPGASLLRDLPILKGSILIHLGGAKLIVSLQEDLGSIRGMAP
jgi:hypothetical protein